MKLIKHIALVALALVVLVSCEKDPEYNQGGGILLKQGETGEVSIDGNHLDPSTNSHLQTTLLGGQFIDYLQFYFESDAPDVGKALKKRYGLIQWSQGRDHSVYHDEGQVAFIPFINKKGTEVSSIMLAFKGTESDLTFHIAERKDIRKYNKKENVKKNAIGKSSEFSREFIGALFLFFDDRIYDKVDCDLLESLSTSKSRDVVCDITWYEVTECYCSEAGGVVSCYDCSTSITYEEACGGGASGGPHFGSTSGGSSSTPGDFYIPLCKKSFSFEVPPDDPDLRVAKMWGPNSLDAFPYPYYCSNVTIIEIPTTLGANPDIAFTAHQARWIAARAITNVLRDVIGADLDLRNCTKTRSDLGTMLTRELRRVAADEKGITRSQQKQGWLNGLRAIVKSYGQKDDLYPSIDPTYPKWELDSCLKNHNMN